jgi:hypothetical protein
VFLFINFELNIYLFNMESLQWSTYSNALAFQGVCIGLSEVMGSAGKHQLLSFMDELIPTIRTALCDRYAFLQFFHCFYLMFSSNHIYLILTAPILMFSSNHIYLTLTAPKRSVNLLG